MKAKLKELPQAKRKWMVHVLGGGNPTKVHDDLGMAAAEAVRLCEKTGRATFVLESIGVVYPPKPQPAEATSA